MRHVILTRGFQDDRVTLGMLQIEDVDHEPIYTLENPWLNNKAWVSCVLAGDYMVKRHKGYLPHTKDCYKIYEVDGRTDILIHRGNWESNTTGCILLGLGSGALNNKIAVLKSGDAMDYFKKLMGRKAFSLTIGELK